jgi:hypothetical protein
MSPVSAATKLVIKKKPANRAILASIHFRTAIPRIRIIRLQNL